jgi:KaiC/GvpD/RAD55 family RecA-like ATPase
MAKVQIGEELDMNQIILLLMPSAEYSEVTVDTIKQLSNKRVCYVTLNKTHDSLKEQFKKQGADVKNIFFIDCISKTFKSTTAKEEDTTFVSSPGALTELSIAISNKLKEGFDYLIFDSLTNLLIYEKKAPVAKFVSGIVNKVKASNTKAVLYALKVKEQSAVIEEAGIFVDKIIDLSE